MDRQNVTLKQLAVKENAYENVNTIDISIIDNRDKIKLYMLSLVSTCIGLFWFCPMCPGCKQSFIYTNITLKK